MLHGPLLWFANRGTGLVLLALLTLATLLGVLATRGSTAGRVPRFPTQAFHRSISLLAVMFLGAHVLTAVTDEYVDITWWQAVVPLGATYKPLWLALGTLSLDLLVVVTVTSLLRHRMGHRPWRAVHLSAYVAWLVALVHGFGIGTDSAEPWARWVYLGSAAVVTAAVLVRLGGLAVSGLRARRRTTPGLVVAGARR